MGFECDAVAEARRAVKVSDEQDEYRKAGICMGKTAAIILAAGSGSRMGSEIPKQFLELLGKPVFVHSVRAFDGIVQKLILVTAKRYVDYCGRILEKERLTSPWEIVPGGTCRYDSSMAGLEAAGDCDIVMIHDAARACVDRGTIQNSLALAQQRGTGVAAVALKDTVKLADTDGEVLETPDRSKLKIIQTPQSFQRSLITEAYCNMRMSRPEARANITDDAMVVELFTDEKVYLSEGNYENMKITTPEDMYLAEMILKRREGRPEC